MSDFPVNYSAESVMASLNLAIDRGTPAEANANHTPTEFQTLITTVPADSNNIQSHASMSIHVRHTGFIDQNQRLREHYNDAPEKILESLGLEN